MKYIYLLILMCCIFPSSAQTFTETGKTYPVNTEGDKCVINGFTTFNGFSDEKIYANTLLWAIENICPQLREGLTNIDVPNKTFDCEFTLGSSAESGLNNTYYVKATFRVADGKLLYYLHDVLIESTVLVMKKVTPLEKLAPEKKVAHKKTMDDFVKSESSMLNKLFDFIATYQLAPITHWSDIAICRPVEGMNEDECRLAFGKPQSIIETNGETQWMYTSSFYLFFQNGKVKTIIK
ncbi:hypothetical protein [Phocaeicola sp. HCN-6420]|jgi:hypothetical protein|uniref:hypothetical protein n=1 Tax=Phocaeicola sp. HCN-6420 TaxID=3134673 RepID=UPI0030BCB161